jgi:hypothetical protein
MNEDRIRIPNNDEMKRYISVGPLHNRWWQLKRDGSVGIIERTALVLREARGRDVWHEAYTSCGNQWIGRNT